MKSVVRWKLLPVATEDGVLPDYCAVRCKCDCRCECDCRSDPMSAMYHSASSFSSSSLRLPADLPCIVLSPSFVYYFWVVFRCFSFSLIARIWRRTPCESVSSARDAQLVLHLFDSADPAANNLRESLARPAKFFFGIPLWFNIFLLVF